MILKLIIACLLPYGLVFADICRDLEVSEKNCTFHSILPKHQHMECFFKSVFHFPVEFNFKPTSSFQELTIKFNTFLGIIIDNGYVTKSDLPNQHGWNKISVKRASANILKVYVEDKKLFQSGSPLMSANMIELFTTGAGFWGTKCIEKLDSDRENTSLPEIKSTNSVTISHNSSDEPYDLLEHKLEFVQSNQYDESEHSVSTFLLLAVGIGLFVGAILILVSTIITMKKIVRKSLRIVKQDADPLDIVKVEYFPNQNKPKYEDHIYEDVSKYKLQHMDQQDKDVDDIEELKKLTRQTSENEDSFEEIKIINLKRDGYEVLYPIKL